MGEGRDGAGSFERGLTQARREVRSDNMEATCMFGAGEWDREDVWILGFGGYCTVKVGSGGIVGLDGGFVRLRCTEEKTFVNLQ